MTTTTTTNEKEAAIVAACDTGRRARVLPPRRLLACDLYLQRRDDAVRASPLFAPRERYARFSLFFCASGPCSLSALTDFDFYLVTSPTSGVRYPASSWVGLKTMLPFLRLKRQRKKTRALFSRLNQTERCRVMLNVSIIYLENIFNCYRF